MRKPRPQAARRPLRPTTTPRLEALEDRTLLDAANVFAGFTGELTAGETRDTVLVHLAGGNFTIPGSGFTTLGFLVTPGEGSGLKPNPVDVDSLAPGSDPFRYGVFRHNHRKRLARKDLAGQIGSPILTVDTLRDGWELRHAWAESLARLDGGTDEDLCRAEQATTQRAGGVVLRHGPGALLFVGQRGLLHGRLA